MIRLVDDGKVNFSIASSLIFSELIKQPSVGPLQLAIALNVLQNSDANEVSIWVEEALAKMPDKVAEYKKGKKGLIGLFVGEVKKISKGRAGSKINQQAFIRET